MASMPSTLNRFYSGKGKTLWKIAHRPGFLLMEMRNSLSTHNVVHTSEIPGKGEIIALQTLFMYLEVLTDVPTHILAYGKGIYEYLPEHDDYPPDLHRRSFIVRQLSSPEYELVFRRYSVGSLAKALKKGTDPYGYGLPQGLPLMHRFDDWLFTPTEKSKADLPLLAAQVEAAVPVDVALARRVIAQGDAYLASRGLAAIDAKLEIVGGILVDDWLNGDCTRIARTSDIREGEEPPFLDKERFRQIALRKRKGRSPGPPLVFSADEIREGMQGYRKGTELMTGATIEELRYRFTD